ncbi:glycosyl hydrolase family 18 protein [Brevibacillus dissolubilis]|uniref:glycosyl hydrolase family 18 protein n=1 Tax=Brevibacillus dissolubilis TaxID=1844116 RepID=UPI001116D3D6|nr:glycosyl hydrolase family 18 protein [Brevibacillus dissolubilis]
MKRTLFMLLVFVLMIGTSLTHAATSAEPVSFHSSAPTSLEEDLQYILQTEDSRSLLEDFNWQAFDQKRNGKKVLGYYVGSERSDRLSYDSLITYNHMLTDIAFVTYNTDKNGHVTGDPSQRGISLSHSTGKSSYLVVTNHSGDNLFDKDVAHAIVSNTQVQERFISELLALVQSHRAAGVNLDFENVPATDRNAFSSLVARLATRLHVQHKLLIVSVPGKEHDNPRFYWNHGFDYATIGRYSDYVQIMTYDEHGPWSDPGPVASYPWVKNCVIFAVSQIPPHKILLGIPGYGYDWNPTEDTAVLYKHIPALIKETKATVRWDSKAQTPTLTYRQNNQTHTIWYENEQSLKLKRNLVEQYHLAGYGVWRMGFEDQSFWNVLIK